MSTPDAMSNTLPDNVHPIRQEMMFVFDANTPIIDPAVQERVDCRRYEAGKCRDCDEERGQDTYWCRDHFPWAKEEWAPRIRKVQK